MFTFLPIEREREALQTGPTGEAADDGAAVLGSAPTAGRDRAFVLVLASLVVGLVARGLAREHLTWDTTNSTLLWYAFVREHGIAALREAFTNYTPVYSYLLLIASWFDSLAAPVTLIKAISAVFELGCAIVAAELVLHVTRAPRRAALAFCGIWLAPTVWFNGAMWGQTDAIWSFFLLVSISLFLRGRNGVAPFAIAVAVKAQAVFLGPFILAMILRRKLHWAWLAAVPLVYLVLAVPVLVAGRPLVSVLMVYADQAQSYHELSKGAANLWVFATNVVPYSLGVPLGLLLAGAAGVALAFMAARSRRNGPEFVLLVACVSLFLMPFLLPKMHDRYFYAFEVAIIPLACLNPRFLPFAAIAQFDGVLAYLPFDFGMILGLPVAAVCNSVLGVFLLLELFGREQPFRVSVAAWGKFGAAVVLLPAALIAVKVGWSLALVAYAVAAGLAVLATLDLLRAARSPA